jgi:hypothetical protein
MDFIFIAIVFLFFILAADLAYGCAKLGGVI